MTIQGECRRLLPEEGTLRQHMITASGRIRDTVYFGILDREWPEVGRRLRRMLQPRQRG